MTDDMYLSLAADLYENGTWSKDMLIKKVTLYAQGKNMDMNAINEYLDRLTKPKEYTIDEKRKFLSVVKLDGSELKYGDVVKAMPDEMIEKFYDAEVTNLDKNIVEAYHDLANSTPAIERNNSDFHTPDPIESTGEVEQNNEQEETLVVPNPFESTAERENSGFHAPDPIGDTNGAEEPDMPDTEEAFEQEASRINSPERDSSVRTVAASPERIEKLKKTKHKAINYFLKTAIVVTAVALLHPVYSIGLIGGYLYFASEIKNGRFNPEKSIGKAVKSVVEKVMNIGMPKEEVMQEEGRTR